MTRLTWQEYFEQFIRVRLQNLAAMQASGRELIEQLRAIAADYKGVLFDDKSPYRDSTAKKGPQALRGPAGGSS